MTPENREFSVIASLLHEHRRSGEPTILLNLCEQSFRSLFDQYTDLHRQLFVALVLDQILLSCPHPFFLLYSHSDSDPEGFTADDVFQSYAVLWLRKHGYSNFCIASSLTIPDDIFAQIAAAMDLAITGHGSLMQSLNNARCPLLVLMGDRKSYRPLPTLGPILTASPLQHGRIVAELHAISSEVASFLSKDHYPADLRQGEVASAPNALRSRRARLAQHLPFLGTALRPFKDESSPLARGDTPPSAQELRQPDRHEFEIHDPNLESSLLELTKAHFQSLVRHPDRVGTDLSSITLDGDPSFVPDMLARDSLHDEDYVVFGGFKDPQSLILDVGANWGYSVSSIEASGAKSGIVSFEAIPMYRPCLAAVSEMRGQRYQYFMTALSDQPSELIFTVPVVNNQALSALTTAAEQPNLEGIASNVVSYIRHWMTDLQNFDYRLVSFRVPVQRLDDVIQSNPNTFRERAIAAIKIDVEGMEYPVLRGAEQLLLEHQPLIMAEGGANNEALIQYLLGLGYLVAQRDDFSLVISATSDRTRINGFFVHHQQVVTYRELGILR